LIITPTASQTIESISSNTYFTKLTEEGKISGLTPREFIDKGDPFYREKYKALYYILLIGNIAMDS